jgi:hypothetical protein
VIEAPTKARPRRALLAFGGQLPRSFPLPLWLRGRSFQ